MECPRVTQPMQWLQWPSSSVITVFLLQNNNTICSDFINTNLIMKQANIPSKIWKVPEKLGFSIRQANFQPIKHQDGHISRNELAKMEIYFFGTKVLCAPPRHHWDCCGLQLAYQERKKYSGWRGVVYLTEILVSTPLCTV